MKKKAVLVSGASSGIGAATAKLFSRKGYFVFLLGRNEERLHEVALECSHGASLLKCDLSNEAQLEKYSKHLFERPDVDLQILVNNAAIYERHEFLQETGIDTWRRQFEINLFGSIRLTQKVLPLFLQRKSGAIVNVSSTVGIKPVAGVAAYAASKAALNSWTQSLALELGPHNIRVNAVTPGIVDTPIHSFHNSPEKEAVLKNILTLQTLQKIGQPEDVAQAIYYLGSEESSWTTGTILTVDGGISLK